MTELVPGVRLGVDYGAVRIGLAKSDISATLSSPLMTISRKSPGVPVTDENERSWQSVANVVKENDVAVVYVGDPVSLSGKESTTTIQAREWARGLARSMSHTPVHLVDERFSSAMAESQLHQTGRKPSTDKALIDAAAAAVLLQHALDFEARNGRLAGYPAADVA